MRGGTKEEEKEERNRALSEEVPLFLRLISDVRHRTIGEGRQGEERRKKKKGGEVGTTQHLSSGGMLC